MTFAPRTWVVGETVTAALMNTQIRDQFNSMFAAWTTYTPAWTAVTTNPVIGNGTLTGRHITVGVTSHVSILLIAGSTTTFGTGSYSFSLPFTSAAATVSYLGTARLTGTDTWIGQTFLAPNASVASATFPASATNTRGANMSPTLPETHANGSTLRLSLTFQTA